MKKYLILLICIFGIACGSNAELRILRIHGNVSIKENNELRPIKPREVVTKSTILNISPDASVTIVDNDSRIVYSSAHTTGKISVQNIIYNSTREANKITSAIARQAVKSIQENTANPAPKGVSYRNQTSDESYEQSLANAILNNTSTQNGCLHLHCITESDSIQHLKISNNSDQTLYINILSSGNDKAPQLIIPVSYEDEIPCITITPGITELDHYKFFDLTHGSQISLLASPKPFDSNLINLLLRRKPTADKNLPDIGITLTPLSWD